MLRSFLVGGALLASRSPGERQRRHLALFLVFVAGKNLHSRRMSARIPEAPQRSGDAPLGPAPTTPSDSVSVESLASSLRGVSRDGRALCIPPGSSLETHQRDLFPGEEPRNRHQHGELDEQFISATHNRLFWFRVKPTTELLPPGNQNAVTNQSKQSIDGCLVDRSTSQLGFDRYGISTPDDFHVWPVKSSLSTPFVYFPKLKFTMFH